MLNSNDNTETSTVMLSPNKNGGNVSNVSLSPIRHYSYQLAISNSLQFD